MDLMIEFLGVCQLQLIFHVWIMPNTLERGKHQMLTRVLGQSDPKSQECWLLLLPPLPCPRSHAVAYNHIPIKL